jgi:hypothetical protein
MSRNPEKQHCFDETEAPEFSIAFGCGGIFAYDAKESLLELKPEKSGDSGRFVLISPKLANEY